MTEDMLLVYAGDEARAKTLRELGFSSHMCVPMHGRDSVLGTRLVK